jgi:hypothetical protein
MPVERESMTGAQQYPNNLSRRAVLLAGGALLGANVFDGGDGFRR